MTFIVLQGLFLIATPLRAWQRGKVLAGLMLKESAKYLGGEIETAVSENQNYHSQTSLPKLV
jgi:hypothetical protein